AGRAGPVVALPGGMRVGDAVEDPLVEPAHLAQLVAGGDGPAEPAGAGLQGPPSLRARGRGAGGGGSVRARARRSSPSDQAWNGQPPGVWGGSPSATSHTWSRPASSRWASRG